MSDDVIRIILSHLDSFDKKLDAISGKVYSMEARITGIEARLVARTPCPNPGACDTLREDFTADKADTKEAIDQLTRDIQEHKILVAKVQGGWQALAWLCAACSTLGGLVGWGMSHFSK